MFQAELPVVEKAQIIAEIKRTAAGNGGQPLGRERFFNETGIKTKHWYGKYWARWGDALKEAGFPPNVLQAAHPDSLLIEKLCELTRELGHYPLTAEIRMKEQRDATFPSHTTFRRLGTKEEAIQRVIQYAKEHGWDEVVHFCPPTTALAPQEVTPTAAAVEGFVYLAKFGKYYKIGRTSAVGRREYELAIQLPEKLTLLHQIKTDDPAGIESYWHTRFSDKRQNGEWFALTREDIAAFKRRKFM